MLFVAEANLLLIALAVLIGFVVGFWTFRRNRAAPRLSKDGFGDEPLRPTFTRTPPAPAALATDPASLDHEGDTLADQGAAAAADVTGQIFGVEVHSEIPGADGPPDNLQLLKGVGPKLAANLNQNGITRYEHLARLSENEIGILDERLGAFRGRLARDRIGEQASYLARGDTEGFEARFGKIGGGPS